MPFLGMDPDGRSRAFINQCQPFLSSCAGSEFRYCTYLGKVGFDVRRTRETEPQKPKKEDSTCIRGEGLNDAKRGSWFVMSGDDPGSLL